MPKKRKAGQPAKYRTAYQLQQKIDSYFKDPPKTTTMWTKEGKEYKIGLTSISGLALYLGFCDRHSFYDQEKNPKFSHTIKKARARLSQSYEDQVTQGNSCAIFMLKNLGYTDKQVIEQQGDRNPGIKLTCPDGVVIQL